MNSSLHGMAYLFIRHVCVFQGVSISYQLCRRTAKQRLAEIFSRHGALEIDLPLMLPKLSHYEHCQQNVTFMDHAGNLVSLPYDLRVSR